MVLRYVQAPYDTVVARGESDPSYQALDGSRILYAPGGTRRQHTDPDGTSYERLDGTQGHYAGPDANQAAHGHPPDIYERAVPLNPDYEATDINV